MTPIEQRRFLFITGKGGTGKTTLTAAMARALAARGKRVLIVLTEPKERVSSLLGVPPLGPDIASVLPNIFAVKTNPEAALREYGQMILKSRAVYSAVFENKVVKGFFSAVPGLHQWAMLGKAWYHSTEQLPDGRPRFDIVLFDAPATGHGLEMLRVPKVIVDTVPPGLLRREAERAWATFRNPNESGVIIVALPEDMPATESIELGEAITGELGLPIARVVVNQVMDRLFDDAEHAVLLEPRDLTPNDPGDEAIGAAVRRAISERVQIESLAKIRAGIAAPITTLPRLLDDPSTPAAVESLSRWLDQMVQSPA